jgi:hypothetical protein
MGAVAAQLPRQGERIVWLCAGIEDVVRATGGLFATHGHRDIARSCPPARAGGGVRIGADVALSGTRLARPGPARGAGIRPVLAGGSAVLADRDPLYPTLPSRRAACEAHKSRSVRAGGGRPPLATRPVVFGTMANAASAERADYSN